MKQVGMLLIMMVVLLGCDATSSGGSNPPQNSAQVVPTSAPAPQTNAINTPASVPTTKTVMATPTQMPTLPPPNGSPYEPTTPTWDPRIPTPKETVDMNMYLTPVIVTPAPPQPTPTPAPPQPAPAAETLSSQPIRHQSGLSPLIWGSQATHSLTIWLGYLSDAGTPQLTNAHPIARWNGDFYLERAKASPDGNSLAVMLQQDYHQEGGNPQWLYVIDLSTNKAQPVPDPMDPQSGYSVDNLIGAPDLIDWIDNVRIITGAEDNSRPTNPSALAIVTKDGMSKSYCAARPGGLLADTIAMSPDRKTIFALVEGNTQATEGYWLIDVTDCSKAHRIVSDISSNRTSIKVIAPYGPNWSPDSSRIAFSGPGSGGPQGETWIWILSDLNGPPPNPNPISPIDKIDTNPVWSPDGKTIALLRADSGPNGPLDSTNFFKYDLSSGRFSQLTNLSGAKNSNLQWSADGRYLLASSALNGSSAARLVAIDSVTGKLTTLLPGSQTAQIIAPLLFK